MRYLKWILVAVALLILIALYQSLSYNTISVKTKSDTIRIGYLNLNKSPLRQSDLIDMHNYRCDVWLFLEWNGNNFNEYEHFEEPYLIPYAVADTFTYGSLVLAKPELNIQVKEFDQESRPYKCDYPKLLIELQGIQIGLLHAPPPVPACGFETREYITDALNDMESNGTNQVLIGDFNATVLSSSYKTITKYGYIDAFKADGYFKGTFGFKSFLPKWLRIDYCFTKGNLEVENQWRFPSADSDHCGIIVDLNIVN